MTQKRYSILAKCYDKRGRLLSASLNEYFRSHPLQKYFSEKAGESSCKIYLHAELRALLLARDRKVYKLTVERYDALGQPALCKPCRACQEAIKAFDVPVVEYTSQEGWIRL